MIKVLKNKKHYNIAYDILPYVGHSSHVTKNKLRHICECFYKDINVNIESSPIRLRSFFSCKDKLPKSFQSSIVYQFTRVRCKA